MKKPIKLILIGTALIVVIIAVIRILSPEDSWVCKNGEWTKHGNPSSAMPIESCK